MSRSKAAGGKRGKYEADEDKGVAAERQPVSCHVAVACADWLARRSGVVKLLSSLLLLLLMTVYICNRRFEAAQCKRQHFQRTCRRVRERRLHSGTAERERRDVEVGEVCFCPNIQASGQNVTEFLFKLQTQSLKQRGAGDKARRVFCGSPWIYTPDGEFFVKQTFTRVGAGPAA